MIIILFFLIIFFNLLKPPLAQACSLCPIHNSQFPPVLPVLLVAPVPQFTIQNSRFSPHPTRPTCRTRPTIHNSEFTIQNSQFRIHNSEFTIQNSQFIIC